MRDSAARLRDGHNSPAAYVKDPALNLFRRPGFPGLAYSDGADVEQRIGEAIRRAHDRGTFSDALWDAIADWPSEYHLSRERHCIVRPLGIEAGDKVLELGCGCGAITRFLGEVGAKVSAVEGAPQRARIAAERCHDLGNVAVFVDDLATFESEPVFDWVLLIGVLEYAPVFSDAADPVGQMLRAAARFLAPGGRLVIAIENKLGLKYFAGCAEDHIGIPFHGVQGLYDTRAPRTFGQGELAEQVRDAGLPHAAFLYPFPDYKLPRIVLHEAALRDPEFDAAGALAQVRSRDYGGNQDRLFDEALVAAEAARNGLLGVLSNSFLVVASREVLPTDDTLAVAFATQRKAPFATQTRIFRHNGAIRVQKTRLCPDLARRETFAEGSRLLHAVGETDYVAGSLAFRALCIARARRGDLAASVAALSPWFDFLLSRAVAEGGPARDLRLPGDHLDATPFNIVETSQGLAPIDQEWRVDRDIPLGWVVTRAVVHSLWGIAGFERSPMAVADVVHALFVRRGLQVDENDIARWLERENEFLGLSTGRTLPAAPAGLWSRQLVPPAHVTEQEAQIARLAQAVGRLQRQLDLIRRSRSWRYLSPVRALGGHIRRQRSRLARVSAGISCRYRPIERYRFAAAAVLVIVALTSLAIAFGARTPHKPFSQHPRIDQGDSGTGNTVALRRR
jgi:SAM-dependent methyltransferase